MNWPARHIAENSLGPDGRRATLLARAADEILGTHSVSRLHEPAGQNKSRLLERYTAAAWHAHAGRAANAGMTGITS